MIQQDIKVLAGKKLKNHSRYIMYKYVKLQNTKSELHSQISLAPIHNKQNTSAKVCGRDMYIQHKWIQKMTSNESLMIIIEH